MKGFRYRSHHPRFSRGFLRLPLFYFLLILLVFLGELVLLFVAGFFWLLLPNLLVTTFLGFLLPASPFLNFLLLLLVLLYTLELFLHIDPVVFIAGFGYKVLTPFHVFLWLFRQLQVFLNLLLALRSNLLAIGLSLLSWWRGLQHISQRVFVTKHDSSFLTLQRQVQSIR